MEQEMFFESNGAKIYGTLTLPKAGDKLPACLFIGGSFPQTRDGDIDNAKTEWFPTPLPGRKLFRDEAEIFTQLGIVTFRYDKRGCGKSEGDCNTTGLFDLVADARMALRWLRSLPEIESHRVGVLGQSEGAVIALMLAAADPEIRFFICQGGCYHNLFEDLLRWQAASFLRLPSATIAHTKQKAPLIYWIYKQLEDLLASARRGETYCRLGDETWAFDYYLPRVREHLDNPPSKYVAQVKCPVLVLHGKLDHNCPYTEKLLKNPRGGNVA